jgi:hypothetical protein
MKKTYTHKQVTFGSVGPKWAFKTLGFEYRTALPGGFKTAERVAHVVSGSIQRTGNALDNLGRANILAIVAKVRKAAV